MPPGKTLIILGVFLIILGVLLNMKGGIPFLGKLPGDFHIERENFSFHFPLGTCILISVIVSLAMWLFRR